MAATDTDLNVKDLENLSTETLNMLADGILKTWARETDPDKKSKHFQELVLVSEVINNR